ncbi:MAG TPA: glycosyltransferase [Opitutaceae bacterium]|jgi:glycosyltransferase involved in cell wall biosynthesis|nr:glycosyltransferase [Opitutaceae bacterium]
MKLCHVVPSLEERYGGPSRSVFDLGRALAEAAEEVELLATAPGPAESRRTGSLRIEVFHRDWPARICRSAGLRSRLAAAEPALIHHHSLWLRTLHYAHQAAARRRVPLVISPRGMLSDWAWQHRQRRKRIASHWIHPGALAGAAGWHATSEAEAQEIRSRGFTQPVCVAPNGVAAPEAAAVEAAAEHWRAACPAVAERPVALFYSRFHRKKRVLELIDLWLERAPRDWLLLLVGIPQDYTPEMLEEYVGRFGGTGRVEVFSGAGRPPPYAVASLFLLPSHNENFGMVIGEALAHGLPVLVTDSTPWAAVGAVGGGWCVPWPDFGAALQAAAAEGPERLRQRGAAGRDWAVREFAWERPARTLAAFYRSLASG